MIAKNTILQASIDALSSEGKGICRIDGMVCFVEGGVPGDVLNIRILKATKNCLFAKIEEIITPSEHRTASDCPLFGKCGGCGYRHITYEYEWETKVKRVKDAFSRIGGMEAEPETLLQAEQLTGYRNKVQFPLTMEQGHVCYGFFRKNSHTIIPVTHCKNQSDEANKLASLVAAAVERDQISLYNEETGKGVLRHIVIKEAFGTGECMLILVVTRKPRGIEQLFSEVQKAFPKLTSIYLNYNKENTNRILGDKNKLYFGKKTLTDSFGHLRFLIGPQSFYQINKEQAKKLYDTAAAYAGEGDSLLDLYCGVGTIGLYLAGRFKKIVGIELVDEAIENAKANAQENNIENAEFYAGDAAEVLREMQFEHFSTVVVDPPRKGLSAESIEEIVQLQPQRLVYVSCDPATQARDAKILQEQGYTLQKLAVCDMFPRTVHVETCALFTKA